MFSIKTKLIKNPDIIIMQNTSILSKQNNKYLSFDLKGSLVKRNVKYQYSDAFTQNKKKHLF